MSKKLQRSLILTTAFLSTCGLVAGTLVSQCNFDAERHRELDSRTKANIITQNGIYEVSVETSSLQQTGTPDYITVKRAFDKNAKMNQFPIVNKTVYDPWLLDGVNQENINTPAFKQTIMEASCQLTKSYIADPLTYYWPTLIGDVVSDAENQLKSSKKFYQAHCLVLE